MARTAEMRHLSVSIERSAEDVYRFMANVENMAQWAAGIGKLTRVRGQHWLSEGPLGNAKVRFTEPNDFLVLDHDVTLPSGITVHNALRVLPNHRGSEVVFSVIRQQDMSDDDYERDTAAVQKDLHMLKKLMEADPEEHASSRS